MGGCVCVCIYMVHACRLRRFRFVRKLCDVTLNDLRPFRLFACGCTRVCVHVRACKHCKMQNIWMNQFSFECTTEKQSTRLMDSTSLVTSRLTGLMHWLTGVQNIKAKSLSLIHTHRQCMYHRYSWTSYVRFAVHSDMYDSLVLCSLYISYLNAWSPCVEDAGGHGCIEIRFCYCVNVWRPDDIVWIAIADCVLCICLDQLIST